MSRIQIVAAGNTYNPSLIILKNKGYRLWVDVNDDDSLIWNATKNEYSFHAFSPVELLGIVVLGETFGEDWNRQSPNILSEVLKDD